MGKTKLLLLKQTLTRLSLNVMLLLLSMKDLWEKNKSFHWHLHQEGPQFRKSLIRLTDLKVRKMISKKTVDETKVRVKNEEDLINGINQAGIKVSSDANRLREEIKTLESECEKAEEDKSTKDNQIRTLKEEIAHQEELIGKLQKEKNGAGEGRQKTEEDIQAMEDRCNH